MEKTQGGGRVLYWAYVAGKTERRTSVRCGETAFELMPLITRETSYANVLLVDLGTHPRLIPSDVLCRMLTPGMYLTDLARRSMPALVESEMLRGVSASGEPVWQVPDTMAVFASYWHDETVDDSVTALQRRHRRIRAISEGCERLPLNVFPIPEATIRTMLQRHLVTLGDLMEFDVQGVQLQSELSRADLAEMYRAIVGTLEVRQVETLNVPDA